MPFSACDEPTYRAAHFFPAKKTANVAIHPFYTALRIYSLQKNKLLVAFKLCMSERGVMFKSDGRHIRYCFFQYEDDSVHQLVLWYPISFEKSRNV